MRHAMRISLLLLVAGILMTPGPTSAQTPPATSEEIQKRREEMERKKREYFREKARAESFNKRVARYVALRDSIPFLTVPGTTNLVRVYVNRHDVKEIARDLYFLTDGATEQGFQDSYWQDFLIINQADRYADKVVEYGPLDAEAPDDNIAVFINIRKQGTEAVVPGPCGARPQASAARIRRTVGIGDRRSASSNRAAASKWRHTLCPVP